MSVAIADGGRGIPTLSPVTQTITTTGIGAQIAVAKLDDGAKFAVNVGAPTGTVNSMGVQIENAADSSVLGFAYYPGGPCRITKPAGVANIQLNCTSFFGTGSIGVTVES